MRVHNLGLDTWVYSAHCAHSLLYSIIWGGLKRHRTGFCHDRWSLLSCACYSSPGIRECLSVNPVSHSQDTKTDVIVLLQLLFISRINLHCFISCAYWFVHHHPPNLPELEGSRAMGFIPHGPMDKASAYGAEDSRFDPWCGSPVFAGWHPHSVVWHRCCPTSDARDELQPDV